MDNAVDTMMAIATGSLEDGDGKRNETIVNSPCVTLPEGICVEGKVLFEKMVNDCFKQAGSVINGESLFLSLLIICRYWL